MKIIISILSIFIFLLQASWANQTITIQEERRIFEETLLICKDGNINQILRMSVNGTNGFIVDIFKRKLNSRIETFMNSKRFYEAVNHCYGEDEDLKSLFYASLIAGDIAGKASGVAIFLLSIRLYGGIIAGTRGLGASLATRYSVPLLKQLPNFLKAGFWLSFVYDGTKKYEEMKKNHSLELEENEINAQYVLNKQHELNNNTSILENELIHDLKSEIARLEVEIPRTQDQENLKKKTAKLSYLIDVVRGFEMNIEICSDKFVKNKSPH